MERVLIEAYEYLTMEEEVEVEKVTKQLEDNIFHVMKRVVL